MRNKPHSKKPNFNHKLVVQKRLNPPKGRRRRRRHIRRSLLHLLGWFVPQISIIKPNRPCAAAVSIWHLQGPKEQLKAPPAVSGGIKDGAIIV